MPFKGGQQILIFADNMWENDAIVEGTQCLDHSTGWSSQTGQSADTGGSGHLDFDCQHRSQETSWEQLIRLCIYWTWPPTRTFKTI